MLSRWIVLGWACGAALISVSVMVPARSTSGDTLRLIGAFLGWMAGATGTTIEARRRAAADLQGHWALPLAIWALAFACGAVLAVGLVDVFEAAEWGRVGSFGFLGFVLAAAFAGTLGACAHFRSLSRGGSRALRFLMLEGAVFASFGAATYVILLGGYLLAQPLKHLLGPMVGWHVAFTLAWAMAGAGGGVVVGAAMARALAAADGYEG